MIRTINNKIVVMFDDAPETPMGLIIPERYVVHNEQGLDDENGTKTAVTTNRRLINPQTLTVLEDNGSWVATHGGERIHTGRRYFCYYGAYETAQWLTDDEAIIDAKFIFFQIDPIVCMPGIYLGEEVFGEGVTTASGIILKEGLKDGVRVKLTHVPPDAKFKVDDVVITYNDKNYPLLHDGHNYLKVTEDVIVGIETSDGDRPIDKNLLVEYLPDPDAEERERQNDEIKERIRLFNRLNFHIEPVTLDLIPEPKQVMAKLIAKGDGVDWKRVVDLSSHVHEGDLMCHRNYGVKLPNGQWIISEDTVLWRREDG